jgi:hypothetical protein
MEHRTGISSLEEFEKWLALALDSEQRHLRDQSGPRGRGKPDIRSRDQRRTQGDTA